MKKQLTIPTTLVLGALSLAVGAWAADYGNSAGAPSAPTAPSASPSSSQNPMDQKTLNGTVQKVDADHNSVQLKDATGNVQTVALDTGSQIVREGNSIKLAELKKGDFVTIKNPASTM